MYMTLLHSLLSKEFADPDWDAGVDEGQDEQQWQVRGEKVMMHVCP